MSITTWDPSSTPPSSVQPQGVAPSPLLSGLFSNRSNVEQNLPNRIFSFLRRDEVLQTPAVHRTWHRHFQANENLLWKSLYVEQLMPGIKKEDMQTVTDFKKAYKLDYKIVIGSDFYMDYLGVYAGPKMPIPEGLRGENLVFHPEYLSKEIEEDSSLGLDEEGILTQDPSKHATIPSAYARPNPKEGKIKLVIPNTPINISKLTEMRPVEGNRTGFASYSWQKVLNQHGDKKEPSHWTAPNDRLIGFGKPYPQQDLAARAAELQVMNFADTSRFYLLTYVMSGRWPCGDNVAARTSDVVLGNGENPRANQATLFCEAAGPSARVYLISFFDDYDVGVAVG